MDALRREKGLKTFYQQIGLRVQSSPLGKRSSVPEILGEHNLE